MVLFPPEQFIEIALLAFLDNQPSEIEGVEHIYTLTDGQILKQISELTHHIDPLQWPSHYELNDDSVLELRDTGRIWVPPDEQIHCEILASHHDSKIAGHLGTVGTLELVS